MYKKKRKGKPFSGVQRHAVKPEEPASVPDDEIASCSSTSGPSTAQLSDSESEQSIGPSRKKMKYSVKDSSDGKISIEEEENEGYRLISLKNLSTAVSNVTHVCKEGEKFFMIHLVGHFFFAHVNSCR